MRPHRKLGFAETDNLTREDLIDRLLDYENQPRLKVTREWLERQPTDRLRLLVFVSQLYGALRQRAVRRSGNLLAQIRAVSLN